MDRYRSLYKENSHALSPTQHNRINRNIQNASRAKKRWEIFESGRNLNVSPTPKKPQICEEQKLVELRDNKENKMEAIENVAEGNKSRIALVASGKVNSEKATKQESYLLKFIEWREVHKQKEKKRNEIKRRPFIPSGGASGSAFGNSARVVTAKSKTKGKEVASFVPKGHHRFKPPAGLKDLVSEMTSEAKEVLENDRKSFYTVVPTPPRPKENNSTKVETLKPSVLSKTPAISNLACTNSTITPAIQTLKSLERATSIKPTSAKSAKTAAISGTECKPTAIIAPTKKKSIGRVLTYPLGATSSILKKLSSEFDTKSSSNDYMKKTANTINKKVSVAPLAQRIASKNTPCNSNQNDGSGKQIVPKFARPQPPKSANIATRKSASQSKCIGATNTANKHNKGASTGAVGKAHMLQSKQINSPRKVKLATSFKAKKTQVSMLNRPNAPTKITIKGKTLLGGVRTCTNNVKFAIAETPTDLLNINPFEPFVTSTRVKSLSPHSTKAPNISPVNSEAVHVKQEGPHQNIRTHSSTSAKRALLTNEIKQNPPNKIQRQNTKFNFVRYSVGLSELDMSRDIERNGLDTKNSENVSEFGKSADRTEQITVLEVQPENPQGNNQGNIIMSSEIKTKSELEQQKTLSTENERPISYLSSFVSVSRGKVSARKEREKRDSIYLPGGRDSLLSATAATPSKKSEIPFQATAITPVNIEARRILEAVRYFRQQLSNEINRLHALCDQWEEYKQQNLQLLQKSGGEDMINVTIGQTKLLTSRKFQQFKGLIDRCEKGALGMAAAEDGSEDTKPITDVDLEGFWSMLNLQVDNVEKRFENLTRWKGNNWSDPDEEQQTKEVKQKCKPNLTKVKKAKPPVKAAKASSGLQAMLRKMHAEMRKNKESATAVGAANTDVLVLTPTRQRQRRSQSGTPKNASTEQRNSTPRRISVVVRDRKSLSAAATVISLPADSAVASMVAAAHKRHSRISGESPKSFKTCGNELRRSLSNLEKAFGGCNDLLRSTLTGNAQKLRRRSGTPTFIESLIDLDAKQQPPQAVVKVRTPSPTTSTAPAVNMGRKSILKTPGTAKGKPKNVIFNEKLRVKKFKFTLEDDEFSGDEEQPMQTSTEEPLSTPRTYCLRTRKVVLRPSSEFVIP